MNAMKDSFTTKVCDSFLITMYGKGFPYIEDSNSRSLNRAPCLQEGIWNLADTPLI